MQKERIYLCIDMKSFFASVECAERGLNPFDTNLVVADSARGKGAICLAITPKMKQIGVKNRCRLFEIPPNIEYITALPRMKKYIDYTADIYDIYLKYINKSDIHVYSIDESFIDATDYLRIYKKTPFEFTKMLITEIADKKGIPASAGIGTNLFLAKVALDITAKKTKNYIGYLDEELFKQTLWHHKPITDFWQIAKGTQKRLANKAIYDMYGVAHCSPDILYKEFGINAELLIDHSWGRESCTMEDIKNYKGKSKSVSSSQILFEDYSFEKARIVIESMARSGSYELMRRKQVTDNVKIYVRYSKDIIPPTKGHARMTVNTNLASIITPYVLKCFDSTTKKDMKIRKLGIEFGDVTDESCETYDLFTDFSKLEKNKKAEHATIKIQDKFGKNALVRAVDLQDGSTTIIRNKLIGGHNSE